MTIFIDSANINEIKKWVVEYKVAKGVTTNQKIFLQEKGVNFKERIKEICEVVGDNSVSIELTKTGLSDKILIKEAEEYDSFGTNIAIKVPMWGNGRGLVIANKLKTEGFTVNMTCCMSVNQAILACELGVDYVSLFYNRIIDYNIQKYNDLGFGKKVIRTARKIIKEQNYKSLIICGSIREPVDVSDCFSSGAHIVTITPKILEKLPFHPKTEDTIKEFDLAWKALMEK